jgi:hypothetical protein
MHGAAFAFALLAGVSVAAYSIFLRLASGGIHPALGAAVITGVAFLVNVAIAASLHATGSPLSVSAPGVALLVVGGWPPPAPISSRCPPTPAACASPRRS